ncbi:MAG: glycosyltransferase family 2 protein [Clostridia bacterium]|nr:glycosyltransferase family 2 protein [Clostridia bacterium]
MIKFSVIVPLYNCEKYIQECLNSILAQTYPEFEIVVINDGSTDHSSNLVNEYKDSRIKMYTQENRGLFHARLSGLRYAENEICLYVDADDKIQPNLLSELAKEFENGAECVVYGLQRFGLGEKLAIKNNEEKRLVFEENDQREPLRLLLRGKTIQSIVCKAFCKKLVDIEKLQKYPRIAIGEDALHTLELYSNTKKTIFLEGKYYLYRQTLDSMTHKLKFSNYKDNVYKFKKYQETAIAVLGEAETTQLLADLPKRYFRMTITTLLNSRYVATKEEYKKVVLLISDDVDFQKYFQNYFKICKLHYRFIIGCIAKKRWKTLKFLRGIIGVFK